MQNLAPIDDADDLPRAGLSKGFVNHGSVASTARPAGYASIEWMGSVQPTNMTAADTWINTA